MVIDVNAPGLPAHGAAFHSDRTRRRPLPIGSASIALGTPDLAVRGANTRYRAWAFDDGSGNALEAIVFEFSVPEDYVSNGRFELHWANSGTNSGNVAWGIVTKARAAGDDLNSTSAETNATDVIAASTTAGALIVTTHGAAPTLAAGNVINVFIDRFGGFGSDTLTGDAWLVGVDFVYTADM